MRVLLFKNFRTVFKLFYCRTKYDWYGTRFYIQGYIPLFLPLVHSFLVPKDQLRMAAIAKHSLRLIGSHAGVSIGQDGPSQMALEDIALMRALPDSVVLYPCDGVSAYRCVELAASI